METRQFSLSDDALVQVAAISTVGIIDDRIDLLSELLDAFDAAGYE